jgi:hypothetical protein
VTRVTIDAGICGFITSVEAGRTGRRKVSVVLSSECEMVASMNGELQDVELMEALLPLGESAVWQCAYERLKHPCCPVPIGILKAIEVELELALPKDVVIHFDDISDD